MKILVGERKLSKVCVFLFGVFGLWSKYKAKTMASIMYYVYALTMHLTFSFFYTGFMVASVIFISSVNEITFFICVNFTFIAYLVKMVNFVWNEAGMKQCLKIVSNFELENEYESEFLEGRMDPFQRLAKCYYIVPNLCGLTAYLKPLFAHETELPVMGLYPLDWKNNSMDYWIIYVYQVVAIFIEINVNITIELFPSYLMYMLSIQMEILGKRIEDISASTCSTIDLGNDISISTMEQQEILQKLLEYLKLHQKIDQ